MAIDEPFHRLIPLGRVLFCNQNFLVRTMFYTSEHSLDISHYGRDSLENNRDNLDISLRVQL